MRIRTAPFPFSATTHRITHIMSDRAKVIPQARWGILGTGWISSMFVHDLLAHRPNPDARHIIAAVGSSSLEKGGAFVDKLWAEIDGNDDQHPRPQVYADYDGVYNDPNVDVVYVGTPHTLHKKNCLDAIAAGKHVLCEKPFTMNAKEAQIVLDAARAKGVFLMEALWTRFFPTLEALREELVVKKSLGDVQRLFIDFGNKLPLDDLPATSRIKDPALGAGALLDIGVYTLTLASIIMGEWKVGKDHPAPAKVTASLDMVDGMDEANVVVLDYEGTGDNKKKKKTAICTATFRYRSNQEFGRIECTNGDIVLLGSVNVPTGFRCYEGETPGWGEQNKRKQTRVFQLDTVKDTLGFFYEADAVAHDIVKGRKENALMPLDETLRMMKLLDGIRKEAGLKYPADEE